MVVMAEAFDPDATYRYARELLDSHGLSSVSLSWSNTTRQLGQTVRVAATGTPLYIRLSKKMFAHMTEEQRLNVVTHEVAHALTPGHGHDKVWSAKHVELGGDGKRCTELLVEARAATRRWKGTCGHCGRDFYRSRKTERMDRLYCGHCAGSQAERKIDWKAQW